MHFFVNYFYDNSIKLSTVPMKRSIGNERDITPLQDQCFGTQSESLALFCHYAIHVVLFHGDGHKPRVGRLC